MSDYLFTALIITSKDERNDLTQNQLIVTSTSHPPCLECNLTQQSLSKSACCLKRNVSETEQRYARSFAPAPLLPSIPPSTPPPSIYPPILIQTEEDRLLALLASQRVSSTHYLLTPFSSTKLSECAGVCARVHTCVYLCVRCLGSRWYCKNTALIPQTQRYSDLTQISR